MSFHSSALLLQICAICREGAAIKVAHPQNRSQTTLWGKSLHGDVKNLNFDFFRGRVVGGLKAKGMTQKGHVLLQEGGALGKRHTLL